MHEEGTAGVDDSEPPDKKKKKNNPAQGHVFQVMEELVVLDSISFP